MRRLRGLERARLRRQLADWVSPPPTARGSLSGAIALLVPINWPEPFGLVMIEAMACGTPVIAFNHGSVPEIVEPGLTGLIVEDETEAVAAIEHAANLRRDLVRLRFEQRFTAQRMAYDYVTIYRWLATRVPPGLRVVS